jgi:hypothetical protein
MWAGGVDMAKILIASPVRATEPWRIEVFKHYLASLETQIVPEEHQVDMFFIFHNSTHLVDLILGRYSFEEMRSGDTYDINETTHNWVDENVKIVTYMRSRIIAYAKERDYDYLFMPDSDLILHPLTLKTLIEAKKDIIAELVWGCWLPGAIRAPCAWDCDLYDFYPTIAERIKEFSCPGQYKVGMTGACTLISKRVIQSGINYDRIQNLTMWGEDRHFCVKAAAHGFEIWIDTQY